MKKRFLTFVLSLLALFFAGGGFSTVLYAPFFPAFLDQPQPEWMSLPALLFLGIGSSALGVWLWVIAWRPWYRE